MIFISRSMVWAVLLYACVMVICNWEEVRNTIKGTNAVTIVTGVLPGSQEQTVIQPVSISTHSGLISTILALLKDVSGIADIATPR